MLEVLVVIENGIIKDVVSEDEDTLIHIINRTSADMDKSSTVTLSTAESAEVSKVVEENFDFDAYAKKHYGVKLDIPTIH